MEYKFTPLPVDVPEGDEYGAGIYLVKDTTLHDKYLYQDSTFDFNYFIEQDAFLKSLTQREQFILRSYTRHGDEFVNVFSRAKDKQTLVNDLMKLVNNLRVPGIITFSKPLPINIFYPFPLMSITPLNVIAVVTKYINELMTIFKKAPALKTELRVFRGILSSEIKIRPLTGIVSTSYEAHNAGKFAHNPTEKIQDFKERIQFYEEMMASTSDVERKETYKKKINETRAMLDKVDINPCCIYDMILKPGVQTIWIEPVSHYPHEKEIIFLAKNVQASYSFPKIKKYRLLRDDIDMNTFDAIIVPIVNRKFTQSAGRRRSTRRLKPRSRSRRFLGFAN